MISRIIHYCWFGGKPLPEKYEIFIRIWKKLMPEYEICRWDERTFNVNSTPWTLEAYKAGKYAFVSDYVRLKVLYEYGGIYLDTDVKVVKSLAPLQQLFPNFMGFENDHVITSAVMAAEKGSDLIKEFLAYYESKVFTLDIVKKNEANVLMMTEILKKYGFKADNTEQDILINIYPYKKWKLHIFPKTYFCPLDFYHNKKFSLTTYAIHYFDASWLDKETKRKIEKERSLLYKVLMAFISHITLFKRLFCNK